MLKNHCTISFESQPAQNTIILSDYCRFLINHFLLSQQDNAYVISSRDYQAKAIDAVLKYINKTTLPALLELAGGAGKSHIVAGLAAYFSGNYRNNKVLCIAPSEELVTQNHEKYSTISPASIFCGSANSYCLENQVIFCSPLTINNHIELVKQQNVIAIIIDEAHLLTPTLLAIIEVIKPKFIIGMSATPYTTENGFIYGVDHNNNFMEKDKAKNPYFSKLVYQKTASSLLSEGYLTPPKIMPVSVKYDTEQLIQSGKITDELIEKCFGDDKKTIPICYDIVEKSQDKQGVLIYAANIAHCYRVVGYIKQFDKNATIQVITSETGQTERRNIIEAFKHKKIKFLVNFGTLAVGFDAPHVDMICLLRLTKSMRTFQQIIYRGTRLYEGKNFFELYDYADNINANGLNFNDVFNPDISAKSSANSKKIAVTCPQCNQVFESTARPNPQRLGINDNGNFTDLTGMELNPVIPAHMTRRCKQLVPVIENPLSQTDFKECDYKFAAKECPECNFENDITARKCQSCGHEIVDPNKPLSLEILYTTDSIEDIKVLKWKREDYTIQSNWQKGKVLYPFKMLLEHRIIVTVWDVKKYIPPQSVRIKKDGEKWKVTKR